MNPEDIGALVAGSSLLVIITFALVAAVLPIIAYWKILGKVGYPPPLALVILLPLAGLILVYFLAFAEWPALKKAAPAPAGPAPPAPAPLAPLHVETPATPAAKSAFRFCTGCGVGLEGSERFCANCGKPTGN